MNCGEPPCSMTGEHYWHGSSQCSACGERLRCPFCGRFVRENDLDRHECSQMLVAISAFPDEQEGET